MSNIIPVDFGAPANFRGTDTGPVDPPCECSDGHGLERINWNLHASKLQERSKPFPWFTVLDDKVRVQLEHDYFVDIPFTPAEALNICCKLCLSASRMLRDQ